MEIAMRLHLTHLGCAACAIAVLATNAVAQDGSAEPAGAPSSSIVPSIAAAAAAGSEMTILYTNIVGHPANVVPGTGGLPFFFSATGTTVFTRPNISIDGQWVIEVDIDSGSSLTDGAYIRNGALLTREGDPTQFAPAETWGTHDDNVGINSLGAVLITNNLNGGAATTADDVVVLIDAAGTQTLLAREGDLVDSVVPAIAGATWGSAMDGPVLSELGSAGWLADGLSLTVGGTADNDIALLGSAILYQRGTVAPGQMGGGTESWDNFDFQDLHVSIDETVQLVQGDLGGLTTTDDVVAVNGSIVLQEGFVIPGSGFSEPIDGSGIVESWVDHVGNWYARGNNDVTEQDWVVRNGVVVATSDALQEIVSGSGEHWDDTDFANCFFAFDGNSSGAYLIGGVTDAASVANGVLVVVSSAGVSTVIAREDDPIDLDCNGLLDDDAFIRSFGNDDCLLLEDGSVMASITMRNALSAGIGSAFVRIGSGTASCSISNGSGANPLALTCATPPRLAKSWVLDVALDPTTAATTCFLSFAPSAPIVIPLFAPNEFLIDFSIVLEIPAGPVGTHTVPLPSAANRFWVNRPMFAQGFRLDFPGGVPTLVATNRIDAIVGF